MGEEAYEKGDYLSASQFYDERLKESPDDARLQFNYGTAVYKNNMFEEAAQAFNQALKSDDLALQEEAYYNRGNALFQREKRPSRPTLSTPWRCGSRPSIPLMVLCSWIL